MMNYVHQYQTEFDVEKDNARKQVIPQPRLLSHFKRFYKQGRCQLSDYQHSSAIVFQFFYISTPVYERKWFYLILRRLRLGLGLFINCCLFVFHMDSNSTEDLCPDFIYLCSVLIAWLKIDYRNTSYSPEVTWIFSD